MKAIIEVNVPDYQIGQEVSIYFKNTMMIKGIVRELKWIPVSERLPEEYADVICCTDAEEVFIASYLGKLDDGTECFDDDNGMMCEGDVIAWMPLPKPYEPQESEIWNGIHAQITAPKGTFERIFNEAEDDDNDI